MKFDLPKGLRYWDPKNMTRGFDKPNRVPLFNSLKVVSLLAKIPTRSLMLLGQRNQLIPKRWGELLSTKQTILEKQKLP